MINIENNGKPIIQTESHKMFSNKTYLKQIN